MEVPALLILAIGIAVVLVLIIMLRMNAFLALISAALVVSFLSPGDMGTKVGRVAAAFGETAGKIGIVIAMAAIIGRCLSESGAADRIVRMFVKVLGEKRCPISLMTSGFVLSVPIFFDTVFYLLLPLARSMHRRTGIRFMLLVLAMGAGGSITHSLVPPTPGPLIIADMLQIDLGMMIMVGLLVSVFTAGVILIFVKRLSKIFDYPMRPIEGWGSEPEPLPDEKLPGLFASSLPILLPVILISTYTIISALAKETDLDSGLKHAAGIMSVIGNANFAMLMSAAAAITVLWRQRRPSRQQLAEIIEGSLMSGGIIILITSAGGAFGAMLKEAQIAQAVQGLIVSDSVQSLGGIQLLLVAFLVAFVIKFAQGSSTVAMITASAMIAPLIGSPESIGYHPVYAACAIGFGAQCGNWMNDSGFWIFAKMSGLTEIETLKTWTVTVSTLSIVGLGFVILSAKVLPLV